MKAVIFGIDQSNYNFKKLEGIAYALERMDYVVKVVNSNRLPYWREPSDLAFIESDVPENFDMNIFKRVVIWQNWSPSKLLKIASRFPNVKFCLGTRSPIHDKKFRSMFVDKFQTNEYQRYDETNEVIDLSDCEMLDSPVQKLSENVVCAFLPFCTASDPRFEVEKDIDVVYFGTAANRPGVVELLNSLPNHLKLAVHFVEQGGPIHPETCISMYRRAKVCLHEQVGPMWGEFAVRFGEASAQGCRIISYARSGFTISEFFRDELVPEHDVATDLKNAVDKVLLWCNDLTEIRKNMRKNSPTHVDFVKRVEAAFQMI